MNMNMNMYMYMYMYTHNYIYVLKNRYICMYLNHAATSIFCFSKGFGSRIAWWRWEAPSNFPSFGSSLRVFSLEMVHRAGLGSVEFTTRPSRAQKTAEDRCEGTVLGLRDCQQGTLVTEDFTSGIESEEKSLTIK